MAWKDTYPKDRAPSAEEIDACVGSPLWGPSAARLRKPTAPPPGSSTAAAQWRRAGTSNTKRAARALCTLYPNEGYFSCMVVVGERVLPEAELLITACDPYTQELFRNTKVSMGGKWLYIRREERAGPAGHPAVYLPARRREINEGGAFRFAYKKGGRAAVWQLRPLFSVRARTGRFSPRRGKRPRKNHRRPGFLIVW